MAPTCVLWFPPPVVRVVPAHKRYLGLFALVGSCPDASRMGRPGAGRLCLLLPSVPPASATFVLPLRPATDGVPGPDKCSLEGHARSSPATPVHRNAYNGVQGGLVRQDGLALHEHPDRNCSLAAGPAQTPSLAVLGLPPASTSHAVRRRFAHAERPRRDWSGLSL